ncbi:MAG: 8-amino-7-oxononanoate synthase [Chloroflexi bacterium AL-W]|nr:8-amino-7-oxononanoate synthase [Chloroflexi bacterium AL-N1]NOK69187.1 8-amino-7-oxononanoate synthase [Chloroflexi bacterium AL-N10]NOK77170.1 8-amino-7-oxononanoate synthase [Chloroflexi bacterium AL-N5]NOK83815.1 8-amino-7-oxononanoate synthase [Chloroflexi bacterium AL-W]NOK91025.1 8-amino-7-oxononanoate synthase [Chloroflexi bacterium AL-N15]
MDVRLQKLQRRLEMVQAHHNYRQLTTITHSTEPWFTINGQPFLNLSSNNYLGLATHPDVQHAAANATTHGCGAGASRLITGTTPLHQQLEARLAQFKGRERALLFTSGYTANIGVIPALVGSGDLIFSDALNHASLIDGCRLSRATCHSYPHCDVAALEQLLSQSGQTHQNQQRLVVTDTVFSMDGDLAPLADIARLCQQYDALLFVDEAHATGCIGPGGRGLVAHLGLEEEVTVTMSTLSKALGNMGAFVAGPTVVIEYLINFARSFIFTTALPPTVVAAALAALDTLEHTPQQVQQVQQRGAFFRRGLQELGFNTLASQTHIVPIMVEDSAKTLEMAAALREEGLFVVAIRPPTVAHDTARLRACVMASHTEDDLIYAVEAFERVGRRFGLI